MRTEFSPETISTKKEKAGKLKDLEEHIDGGGSVGALRSLAERNRRRG